MSTALTYLYYAFDKLMNTVFNDMQIVSGVSLGWVLISLIIFSMFIQNVLYVPRISPSRDSSTKGKEK